MKAERNQRRRVETLLAVVAAFGCSETGVEAAAEFRGTYELVSISDRPLPARYFTSGEKDFYVLAGPGDLTADSTDTLTARTIKTTIWSSGAVTHSGVVERFAFTRQGSVIVLNRGQPIPDSGTVGPGWITIRYTLQYHDTTYPYGLWRYERLNPPPSGSP